LRPFVEKSLVFSQIASKVRVLATFAMGLKVRTFALVLDRPAAVYRASEVVSGQCVLALDGDMHLSQLTITLKGEAECEWTEQKTVHQSHGSHPSGPNHGSDHHHNHHHHDHNQTRTETVRHHAKHTCVDLVYCPGNGIPCLPPNSALNPVSNSVSVDAFRRSTQHWLQFPTSARVCLSFALSPPLTPPSPPQSPSLVLRVDLRSHPVLD
jgi:hypothetical protein